MFMMRFLYRRTNRGLTILMYPARHTSPPLPVTPCLRRTAATLLSCSHLSAPLYGEASTATAGTPRRSAAASPGAPGLSETTTAHLAGAPGLFRALAMATMFEPLPETSTPTLSNGQRRFNHAIYIKSGSAAGRWAVAPWQ